MGTRAEKYARTKRYLRAGGHIVRALLVICAIAAFSTLWAWQYRPQWISALDKKIFDSYSSHYVNRYDAAVALYKENKTDKARAALERLLSDMGTVRKQDRLASAYVSVLKVLIKISIETGDSKGGLRFSDMLVSIDPNNYLSWLERAFHLDNNGDRAGAVEALKRAFALEPQSLQAASSLAELLYGAGEKTEARAVVNGYINANRSGTLTVYYSAPGEAFELDNSLEIPAIAFTGFSQKFTFPIGASGIGPVRIDLAQLKDVYVELGEVAVVTTEGRVPLYIGRLNPYLNDLRPAGGSRLIMTGSKPSIAFNLPVELMDAEVNALEFSLTIKPYVPAEFARMVTETTGQ